MLRRILPLVVFVLILDSLYWKLLFEEAQHQVPEAVSFPRSEASWLNQVGVQHGEDRGSSRIDDWMVRRHRQLKRRRKRCNARCKRRRRNARNRPTVPKPTKTPSLFPTRSPINPTAFPTKRPSTSYPTRSPRSPTSFPTKRPSTPFPTRHPTTTRPSKSPSLSPPTRFPTTQYPTPGPTVKTARVGRPSFLIMMADDMGYGDVSWQGGKANTPNLHRLAYSEHTLLFENFHSSS